MDIVRKPFRSSDGIKVFKIPTSAHHTMDRGVSQPHCAQTPSIKCEAKKLAKAADTELSDTKQPSKRWKYVATALARSRPAWIRDCLHGCGAGT
jgi:hypothetical protein